MNHKSLVLSLIICFAALPAFANDEEMKAEVKPGNNNSALPAESTAKPPPPAKPPSAADFKLRAAVRKKAPFWIADHKHGAAIRINKDGTFSSEAQGGGAIAGGWKAMNGELQISWSDGGEKYAYPVKAGKGGSLTIRGISPVKNRYHLN